jgi:hypothetical protein
MKKVGAICSRLYGFTASESGGWTADSALPVQVGAATSLNGPGVPSSLFLRSLTAGLSMDT